MLKKLCSIGSSAIHPPPLTAEIPHSAMANSHGNAEGSKRREGRRTNVQRTLNELRPNLYVDIWRRWVEEVKEE